MVKSEAVVKAVTTTTTTSRNRPLAQTTELYTGDLVELDDFDKKSKGILFAVAKTTSPCSCQSGVMVTIIHGSLAYTVDRHWLILICKAGEIDFDDDIPF